MEQLDQNLVSVAKTSHPRWKGLYKVAGVALLMTLFFYLSQMLMILSWDTFPNSIHDWFVLFQSNRLLGLYYLNALDIVSITLLIPMFMAFFVALRHVNEIWMTIATPIGLIGIAVFITPRAAMLSVIPLSDQYAAATTDAQRDLLLAAGEAVGSLGQATPATVGFILISVAVLVISIVTLRSNFFSKVNAYTGILASSITFLVNISLVFMPSITNILIGIFGVFWILWWTMTARRFLQLGRHEDNALPQPSHHDQSRL